MERADWFLCGVNSIIQTSPGDTPTQIRSTAGMTVPVYVWQDKVEIKKKDV